MKTYLIKVWLFTNLFVALPLAALAQTDAQIAKKVQLEAGLRARQFLCNNMADMIGRAGAGYTPDDLMKCRIDLERANIQYRQFLHTYH